MSARESQPFRRPRVGMACNQCRNKRVRCDGAKPQCRSCDHLKIPCQYSPVDGRRVRHKETEIKALMNRISVLEEQLQETPSKRLPDDPQRAPCVNETQALDIRSGSLVESQLDDSDSVASHLKDWQNCSAEIYDFITSDSHLPVLEADAFTKWPPQLDLYLSDIAETPSLNCFGNDILPSLASAPPRALDALSSVLADLQINGGGKTIFVGPTSNFHLRRRSPCGKDAQVSNTETCLRYSGLNEEMFGSHEKQQKNALSAFWNLVHPHLPVFGSQTIEAVYQELPEGTFYMMIAIGSVFDSDSPSNQTTQLCETYIRRFKQIACDQMETMSLDNIRTFLLRSYLATIQAQLELATIFLGMACAMAKRMGLHVKPLPNFSLEKLDVRSSVFWCCFWMDRRLATLEGRACLIAACDISIAPALESFQCRSDNSSLFVDAPLSQGLLFSCHVEFGDLQDTFLSKIYSFKNPCTKEDAVSDGYVKYLAWFNSLPTSIKAIQKGQSFLPGLLSLHMCFHSGIILLHRPFLGDPSTIGQLANQRCKESARSISALLRLYHGQFEPRVMDIMVIHAAFTAALVHLALLQCPELATYHSCIRSLRETVKILKWMAPWSPYASLVLGDLKEFASTWEISPANSVMFWAEV